MPRRGARHTEPLRALAPRLQTALLAAALLMLAATAGADLADPRPDPAAGLEVRGAAGDVLRVEMDAFCIEYGKDGPESFTAFSLAGQPAQEDIAKLVELARALREDPVLRAMVLSRSPLYGDLLRHYAAATWLLECEELARDLEQQPRELQRLRAAQTIGEYLLGPEALRAAAQRAIWAVTGVTPHRLREDQERAAQGEQATIAAGANDAAVAARLRLLAPYVNILLAEVRRDSGAWARLGGEWLPRSDADAPEPTLGLLLQHLPTRQLVQAGDASAGEEQWAAAAVYYREALRRPMSRPLAASLAWRLLLAYDRDAQDRRSDDAEQRRHQVQAALAEMQMAAGPEGASPELALARGKRGPGAPARHLLTAERALSRGEHLACVVAARRALAASPTPVETCQALRLAAEAELATGQAESARRTLADLLEAAARVSTSQAELFGIDSQAVLARLYLRRLDLRNEPPARLGSAAPLAASQEAG